MTASFEGSGEIFVHYLTGSIGVYKTAGHNQHIGIVMLTNKMSHLRDPAETGTDTLMLV
ncbi:MAG: hypothetical protein BWY95_02484 [Bacteroidetes bacterium ADurb.BinA104]|nr:MAG: hypothetical protein BWY95_02484 [Bacteroidetes bacterium ADurb.BinA104]